MEAHLLQKLRRVGSGIDARVLALVADGGSDNPADAGRLAVLETAVAEHGVDLGLDRRGGDQGQSGREEKRFHGE